MQRWFLPQSRGWALARRAFWECRQRCDHDAQPAATPDRYPLRKYRELAFRQSRFSSAPWRAPPASPATDHNPRRWPVSKVRKRQDRSGESGKHQIPPCQPAAPHRSRCTLPRYDREKPRASLRSTRLCGPAEPADCRYCHCVMSGRCQTACSLPYPKSFRAKERAGGSLSDLERAAPAPNHIFPL